MGRKSNYVIEGVLNLIAAAVVGYFSFVWLFETSSCKSKDSSGRYDRVADWLCSYGGPKLVGALLSLVVLFFVVTAIWFFRKQRDAT